jgi:class 3 adenylate cyclase/predicted ATPase
MGSGPLMQQTLDWLDRLGMSEYASRFVENRIDFAVLPDLTDQHLKDLGIALGDRLKLLRAIRELAGNPAISPKLSSSEPKVQELAERRQVTVMFCDLVGSTALATRMDPEDLREVIAAYQKCVAEVVPRCGGFVARYVGDGVLVYFGYPQAHEDDAERAVRTALELVARISELETHAQLQARVGIATGRVIVGDLISSGEAQERGMVGETPNLAARLQAVAEAGGIVIADSTRRLVGNLFELADLGPKDLKGFAKPVRAWAALRERPVESRFEALHVTGLTGLVGREEELDLLLRRWPKVKCGEGQVVLLSGEPGIGKSRLIAAALHRLAAEPHQRLRYLCSPQHTGSVFFPIIGQIERAAGLTHDDTPKVKLDKLDALLAPTATASEDAALVAEILSIPNDGRYCPLELTPQQRREGMLEAFVRQIEALSRRDPVLMILEDGHWADPTTLEAVGRAVDRIASLQVLLILTFRPEFVAPWVGRPHVTALILNRLTGRDVEAIIDQLVGNTAVPATVRKDIIHRSDGIPLFVEEMTKTALEAESEGGAQYASAAIPAKSSVPDTLHASLMARLDRLGPTAREVAQTGAAIGREFSYELLAAVTARPEPEARRALDQLVAAGLVFQRGSPPAADYQFKHALVQDAAYSTLLRGPRQALHGRVAAALQERYPETADTQPELLAQHFAEAGLTEQAVAYWEKAGQRSLSHPAMAEAAVQFRNALDLLMKLPHSEERDRKELDLLVALGSALAGAKGYGGDELHRTNARARELSMRGDTRHLIVVFHGSFLSQLGRNVPGATPIGEELLRFGRERGDTTAQMMAHRMLGIGFWHLGRPISSRAHVEQALALYEPTHRSMQSDIATARGHCLEYLSFVLVPLGYAEQSNMRYHEARAETRELIAANPRTLRISGGYFNCCVTQYLRRDVDRTAECADLLVDFARQNGLGPWAAAGKIWQGWVRFERGGGAGALAQMREGLAEYRAAGTPHLLYRFIMVVADVEARLGFRQDGLAHVAEASTLQDSLGAGAYACDLLRIRGELLAQSKEGADAEACFRQSIALAREQQAPMWELRSAVGLGRLWAAHGRSGEIRNLLTPIYSRFTEGFDTPDLIEAKALLDETG